MLIAFLALFGVDLAVVVALAVVVLGRKRWVKRQPGAFHGAVRVVGGEVDGFSSKWRRGYGRWVRDVLVWTKAPFLFRNEIVAAGGLESRHRADPGEVKHLGDRPTVIQVDIDGAALEVAADGADTELLLGPFLKEVA